MADKIPIGKYKCMRNSSGEYFHYAVIKLKDEKNIKDGDIITLDMIEPYESEAVRKVAEYLLESVSISQDAAKRSAKEIVDLVHEAEDADD